MQFSKLIDTHCHLDLKPLCFDVASVLKRALQKFITNIITIGIDLKSSKQAVKLAEKYEPVFAAVGIHPHDAKGVTSHTISEIEQLLLKEKVVALGEIGLDYYKEYSPVEIQKKVFQEQLEVALKKQVPVIIHARDSYSDVLSILKEYNIAQVGAVIHCFTSNIDVARQALDLGFYLSFTGVITFKKAEELREVVKYVPLDRFFIETDAPFLAPVPFRGKPNEPAYLKEIAEAVAVIKGVPKGEIAYWTTKNAKAFFKLPVS